MFFNSWIHWPSLACSAQIQLHVKQPILYQCIWAMPPKTKWFAGFKKQLPRVDGKVFVITGTTSGTGIVAARTVAELGGEVLLLNRKSGRVEESLQRLRRAVPDGKFVNVECDLQNFASVRQAVGEIKAKYQKIYCLCNNAGIMAQPDEATVDGYDTQMQTNHLSHFLLTAELFPLLEAEAKDTGDARIVNHSSMGRDHTQHKGLEEKYFGKNGGNLGGNSVEGYGWCELLALLPVQVGQFRVHLCPSAEAGCEEHLNPLLLCSSRWI